MAKCIKLRRFRKSTSPSYYIKFNRDITDWTVYFTVKEKMEDSDENAVIDKKITNHQDAVAGKTIITFTSDEVDLKGNYYFSVDYKDDEGNEDVIVYGRIQFVESTRSTRD